MNSVFTLCAQNYTYHAVLGTSVATRDRCLTLLHIWDASHHHTGHNILDPDALASIVISSRVISVVPDPKK